MLLPRSSCPSWTVPSCRRAWSWCPNSTPTHPGPSPTRSSPAWTKSWLDASARWWTFAFRPRKPLWSRPRPTIPSRTPKCWTAPSRDGGRAQHPERWTRVGGTASLLDGRAAGAEAHPGGPGGSGAPARPGPQETLTTIEGSSGSDLSADPLFTDTAAQDPSLDPLSPCVDPGSPSSSCDDVDGTVDDLGVRGGPGGSW